MKLTNLKALEIGKEIQKPTPLHLGLFGHSYPDKSEMDFVEYEELKKYILEE